MKTFGAVLLVAGTCIGSGMIALPLVLSKLGLISSCLLMACIWYVVYYTSLLNLELNLQAGEGLSLGSLGKRFSGKIAEWAGLGSLKLLSFSLLAVYLYGGSSIIQELLLAKTETSYPFYTIASCLALVACSLLLLPLRMIDYFNRLLFFVLLIIIFILIVGLAFSLSWTNLPLASAQISKTASWSKVLPVVFTSFGFQVIFHTLTNYCKKDPKTLKKAFFFGSLIPAVVYLLWTCSILGVVYHENPEFYLLMSQGKAEVGELIQVLSGIARWQAVQMLVWLISLFAIITSIIGVGLGLLESVKWMIHREIRHPFLRHLIAAFITMGPAYLAVLFIPNAFISVLGFAGMILAFIAVLLPFYLFKRMSFQTLHYRELRCTPLLHFSLFVACLVVLAELYNLVG